jgi:hypothetical protein
VGKVFISYSHDSPDHSERVLTLSNQLRALGVDAELDRYHVRPPQGWPHWCEEQLRPEVSSFVLVICTPTYRARVENRVGADEGRGVFWEGAILYNYLYNAKGDSRFIPVLLDNAPEAAIPVLLNGYTHYRIRVFELADSEFGALYRELTSQPETPKPTLGDVVRFGAGGVPIAAKPLPEKEAVTDFPSVGSFWSPFSNEDTVARGEVRFWAIVETFAAMAVFWWVAIRYETFLLLTTSLFVAPLLLLRSEESTRPAVRWIDEGMFPPRWPEDPAARAEAKRRSERRWLWIGSAIGIAVGFGLGYPAAKLYLVGHERWGAFARWAGLGFMISGVAGATITAGAAASVGANRAFEMLSLPILVGMVSAGVIASGAAGLVAGGAAAAGAVAITAAATVAVAISQGKSWAARSGLVIVLSPLFLATILGIWLATLIFRFTATARYAREGYRRLPTNVRRLALCMAPLQQPELLPGLPAGHDFGFAHTFGEVFSELGSSNLEDKVLALAVWVGASFIYFPAWAYRFILKSTLWFWWILLIVGGAPRLDGGVEGLRDDAYRKASAWVGIATTVFAVVGFGFGWLLKPWADNLTAHAKLPTAVALLVLVDWKSIPVVQWVTLFSALTTIAVVILTRDVYVDSQNPQRAARVAAQLPWLGHLVKWKAGFGAVGIALLMLYFVLYANAVHHYVPVSDWTAGWLGLLYGGAAEPLRHI